MNFLPRTLAGKLSVILTAISLIVVIAFFVAMLFGAVSFDCNYCDMAQSIVIITQLLALICSLTALIRFSDKRVSVYISLALALLTVCLVIVYSLLLR